MIPRLADGLLLSFQVEQQTEDHLLVSRYLDNILPGVSLSSLSEAYADDIFADDDVLASVDGSDDVDSIDDPPSEDIASGSDDEALLQDTLLLKSDEEVSGKKKAKKTAVKKKPGRPKKSEG